MTAAKERAAGLRRMAADMLSLADELDGGAKDDVSAFDWKSMSQQRLREEAHRILTQRRKRSSLGIDNLLGEPAWDLLLTLYRDTADSRRILTKSLVIGANTPPTTSLRYIDILVEEGFIERSFDAGDGRKKYLELTAAGRDKMSRCLARSVNAWEESTLAPRNPPVDGYTFGRNG